MVKQHVASDTLEVPGRGRPAVESVEGRKARPVVAWAVVGVLFYLMAGYVVSRFLASGPTANHLGRSQAPGYMKFGVVFYQTVGCLGFVACWWFCVIKPWRKLGRLTTDGLFVIVFTLIYWQDPLSNWNGTLFTYNTMYVNFGSWGNFLPGWLTPNQHILPEPVLGSGTIYCWGIFMGMVLGNFVMRKAKQRWPQLGNAGLIALCFAFFIAFDAVAEPFFMWFFGAWTYPGAIKGLTVFEGHYYQFPLYEALHWGSTWAMFALVRYFVNDKGETLVERGIEEVRVTRKRKTVIRFLALSGVMNAIFFFAYNIPMGLFWAPNGSSWPKDIANRPYFNAGACGPGTDYACSGPSIPMPKAGKSAHVDPDGKLVVPPADPKNFPMDRSDEGNLTPFRHAK